MGNQVRSSLTTFTQPDIRTTMIKDILNKKPNLMTFMNLIKTKERNPYLSSSIFELNFSDVHALYTYLKQHCFLLLMQGVVVTGHSIYRTNIM